jgi:hypothetical protein
MEVSRDTEVRLLLGTYSGFIFLLPSTYSSRDIEGPGAVGSPPTTISPCELTRRAEFLTPPQDMLQRRQFFFPSSFGDQSLPENTPVRGRRRFDYTPAPLCSFCSVLILNQSSTGRRTVNTTTGASIHGGEHFKHSGSTELCGALKSPSGLSSL